MGPKIRNHCLFSQHFVVLPKSGDIQYFISQLRGKKTTYFLVSYTALHCAAPSLLPQLTECREQNICHQVTNRITVRRLNFPRLLKCPWPYIVLDPDNMSPRTCQFDSSQTRQVKLPVLQAILSPSMQNVSVPSDKALLWRGDCNS